MTDYCFVATSMGDVKVSMAESPAKVLASHGGVVPNHVARAVLVDLRRRVTLPRVNESLRTLGVEPGGTILVLQCANGN